MMWNVAANIERFRASLRDVYKIFPRNRRKHSFYRLKNCRFKFKRSPKLTSLNVVSVIQHLPSGTDSLLESQSLAVFESRLKTHLFDQAHSDYMTCLPPPLQLRPCRGIEMDALLLLSLLLLLISLQVTVNSASHSLHARGEHAFYLTKMRIVY